MNINKPNLDTVEQAENILKYKNFMQINIYEMKLTKEGQEMVDNILNSINELKNVSDVLVSDIQASGLVTAAAKSIGITAKTLWEVGKVSIDALPKASLLDYELGIPQDTLYLPIPNTVRDSFSQKYDENNLNLEEKMMASSIGVTQTLSSNIPIVGGAISSAIPEVTKLAGHLLKRANKTIDPNTLMTYSGSIPRHLTFEFTIAPKNKLEADYYNKIISVIKYYSMAERQKISFYDNIGLRTLTTKNCFGFSFYNYNSTTKVTKPLDFFDILIAADAKNNPVGGFYLSNININIGGRSSSQFYFDGEPRSFQLSITFIERQPMYAEDWDRVIQRNKNILE